MKFIGKFFIIMMAFAMVVACGDGTDDNNENSDSFAVEVNDNDEVDTNQDDKVNVVVSCYPEGSSLPID